MSKIVGVAVAALLVLPLLAGPAFAQKNMGVSGIGAGRLNATGCTTIMVPQWQCPPGDEPGNWPLTKCKLVMVPQTVCHAA